IIRSRERMTYTAVNEIITTPEGETATAYAHVKDLILRMHALTHVLIKRREERGAIDFDLPEAELLFNDEGQIGGILPSERNIAHRWVEEFADIAASFGHKFSIHGPVPQRGFQRLARDIRDTPEERMLSYLMLRS